MVDELVGSVVLHSCCLPFDAVNITFEEARSIVKDGEEYDDSHFLVRMRAGQ